MVRDRILMTTLGVSVLFHLSMVTLFSIYVWVPVNRPKYAQLEIKYLEPGTIALAGLGTAPPELSLDLPPATGLATGSTPSGAASLPAIDLPALDPAQLERAEMIASGLRVRSAFEPEARQDSWARFIGQIGKLDDRLRELTPIESVFKDDPVRGPATPIAQTPEGLVLYVEWTGEPRDRKPVPGSSFDSLWGLDAAKPTLPVSVPFKVDALGNVLNVLAPPSGDDFLAGIAGALRQARFAPLDDPAGGNQIGTLVIAPEAEP